jgi:hypothetical protein
LDAELAFVVEKSRCINFRRELCLGTIGDGNACIRRETWLGRARVLEFEEKVIDVSGHAESAALARIIPFDGDASKFVASHVELYPMKFLEKCKQIVEMFHAHIFYTEVIHNEAELKGAPFMAPETGCGRSLVETFRYKARAK